MNTKTKIRNSDLKKTSITFKTSSRMLDRYPWYNPTTLIPSECEVLFIPKGEDGHPDEANAYTRVARYLAGSNSIWEDEWTDLDKAKRGRKIKLTYGVISVDVKKRNLLEYLRVASYNGANEKTNIDSSVLYTEINHEFDAEKSIRLERDKQSAMNFVLNGEISGIRAIALALAKTKGAIDDIHDMDEFSLRNLMRGPATRNPSDFIGKMNDGSIKNKVAIVQALQKGIIKVDEDKGIITWGSNGETIIVAASGMNPIDYFSELSVENDEYRKLLESIKDLLNRSRETELIASKAPSSWDEALIEEALEKGNIIQKGHWFIIPGKEEDDDAIFSVQGLKKLKAAVISNQDNLIALLSAKAK